MTSIPERLIELQRQMMPQESWDFVPLPRVYSAYAEWEYKLERKPKEMALVALEGWLLCLGQDGWEMCGNEYGCFIFKRRKVVE